MVKTVKIDTRLIDLPWTTSTNYRFDIEEGFTKEVGGNRSLSKSQTSALTATTFSSGPYITGNVSPSYNATGVYNTSITYNFDHGVLPTNTSTNKIYLNQKIGSTGTLIASIATTSSRVTTNVQSVTVDVLGLIDEQRTYYLTSDSNIFQDMFKFTANAVGENNVKFTTGVGPQITSTIPAANTSTRYPKVFLTYDRTSLTPQNANYKLYTNTGTLVTSIAGTSNRVSVTSSTVAIDFKDYLQPNSSYYVNAEYSVMKDNIQFSSVAVTSTSTIKFPTGTYITAAPTLTIDNQSIVQSIWMNSTLIAASNNAGVTKIYNRSTGELVRTITLPTVTTGGYIYYGKGLAMNETHIAIGARKDTASLSKVFIYSLSDGSLLHTLTSSNDYFGSQMDMNTTHLLLTNNGSVSNPSQDAATVWDLSTGTMTWGYGPSGSSNTEFDKGAISDSYIVYYVKEGTQPYIYVNSSTTGQFLRKIAIGTSVAPASINISNTHAVVSIGPVSTVYKLSDGSTVYTVNTGGSVGADSIQDNDITDDYFAAGDPRFGTGFINIYSMTTGSLISKIDNPFTPFGTASNNPRFGGWFIIKGTEVSIIYFDQADNGGTNSLIHKFNVV